MPKKDRKPPFAPLPATLERSPQKAQDTYEKTLESAEKAYEGDEARAHRVAWSAVKQGFEKVGNHWEAKPTKIAGVGETFGGVDVLHHTRIELEERAHGLGIEHTSRMTKSDLGHAIANKQRRS